MVSGWITLFSLEHLFLLALGTIFTWVSSTSMSTTFQSPLQVPPPVTNLYMWEFPRSQASFLLSVFTPLRISTGFRVLQKAFIR